MALTQADVDMWTDLRKRDLIPQSPRVLEIGQANWYGDIPPPWGCEDPDPWAVARKWYQRVLGYSSIVAIDMSGPDGIRLDLNQPIGVVGWRQYDIVINTGTTEHIFDQRQVFQTIHERCATNGLMVHVVPIEGWRNHGFYSYEPCFFNDLASANGYATVYWKECRTGWPAMDISPDTLLYVILRKTQDKTFVVPIQGRYQ